MFSVIFLIIRIVKFASSQRRFKLRAGTAREQVETKGLSPENESRLQHAGSLFLVDSALPCEEYNCARNDEKFTGYDSYSFFFGKLFVLVVISMESRHVLRTDQKPTELPGAQSAESKRRCFCTSGSMGSLRKVVGRSDGMLPQDTGQTENHRLKEESI